jgi:riboflavin synthase alpha subunit
VQFEKDSTIINGVSLTVAIDSEKRCCATIIPYTLNTNFKKILRGLVNLEFDGSQENILRDNV